MKDLFKIDLFDESAKDEKDDDILDANIDEAADVSITVPGGDKETPNAKPYDSCSIPIPSKKEISVDEYNSALTSLQKSFKEAVGVMEALQQIKVVDKSMEQRQAEYTEGCIMDALLESYEDGPFFEAVERGDKEKVKGIVKKLRGKIESTLKEDNLTFYKPNAVGRVITTALGGGVALFLANTVAAGTVSPAATMLANATINAGKNVASKVAKKSGAAAVDQIFATKLWQILGVVHCSHGQDLDLAKKLTEKFKDELGEYKILTSPASPTIADSFRKAMKLKERNEPYFLLVDKKLPSELKEFQKAVDKAAKEKGSGEDKKEKGSEKKEDNKEDKDKK